LREEFQSMTPEDRRYLNAREALASERDIAKAVFRVADRNFSEDEARELLEEIYRTNKSENRRTAWMRVIPGVVLLVVFWVVFAATGRLYYLILGGSGLSLAWGIASLLMANGYEVEADEGED
jgi:hypothetical protein